MVLRQNAARHFRAVLEMMRPSVFEKGAVPALAGVFLPWALLFTAETRGFLYLKGAEQLETRSYDRSGWIRDLP
jgi:hypothetical protein